MLHTEIVLVQTFWKLSSFSDENGN